MKNSFKSKRLCILFIYLILGRMIVMLKPEKQSFSSVHLMPPIFFFFF